MTFNLIPLKVSLTLKMFQHFYHSAKFIMQLRIYLLACSSIFVKKHFYKLIYHVYMYKSNYSTQSNKEKLKKEKEMMKIMTKKNRKEK